MELFVNNDGLKDHLNEIKLETLKLQHLAQECIGAVEHNFFEVKDMRARTSLPEQLELYKDLLNKRRDRIKAFNEKKIEQFSKIAPKNKDLQNIIYNHLQSLLED